MKFELPRLPLGISEFSKLREAVANCLYVEKDVQCLWQRVDGMDGKDAKTA